ncbi:MAG: DNA-binding protein [Nitrospirae bacterium GWA2_46_11]|nr:MAG: DNA-binding protein [Nitrospirae bacterium GWA2_46_11]
MESSMIPQQIIESKILLLRGKKVMLDKDLAVLYGVETRDLNKAVKRNIDRFPEDFMFQLSDEEFKNLIFHFGTSSWGGTRKLPYAFTGNGVAMLSSVLNSKRAIHVNIQIMRTFTRIREMLISNTELARKIEALEKKYDSQFKVVFDAIRQLMTPPETKKKKIGFEVRESRARYGTRGRKSAKVLRS